ncbi:hypothetical protein [Bacillus sp. UMB0728]|uniref:hypothetical protein n=1 Tax=Bacillus sp. UMB0728 TaxID=2066052 RepID=UPI000C75B386|nr:hypothetical protein [Bacillus sp. UMB0728]PLR71046.1 hypothetical protein CYJ37_19870 [Bacillus sp. UMB0728]
MNKDQLLEIAMRRLTREQLNFFEDINNNDEENIFRQVCMFDLSLNDGVGIHNINRNDNTGRYHTKDRDIFRPFQYIHAYFKMDHQQIEWLTREIIHMCGLHLESLIKRIFKISRIPLGQALSYKIASIKLNDLLYKDLKVIVKPYNDAKHSLWQEKDSHMFDIYTTVLCYAVTRKLSIELLNIADLYTPEYVWKN